MRCVRCGTELFVLQDQGQAGQVTAQELGRWELRVCLRCVGGWSDYPKVVEMLNRFQLAEFRRHERGLEQAPVKGATKRQGAQMKLEDLHLAGNADSVARVRGRSPRRLSDELVDMVVWRGCKSRHCHLWCDSW